MELKSYQQAVIKDLALYLEYLKVEKGNCALAFEQFWAKHTDFPRTEVYKNNLKNCPHICIKVPTAGGKTFIACNAVHTLVEGLQIAQARAVVWLVPSNAILEQTYAHLNNPKHFYRQKLNALFHHKVAVYKVDDLLNGNNFNQSTVRENLSIFVLSYQSIRADKQTKENRRIYKENGNLQGFFSGLEDKSFLFQGEEVDEISLINVIRKLNPLCIIDEAHNATSDLSIEMLHNINPSFVLELTATPRKDKKDKPISNIISYIDSFELKKENMVKLPLLVHNLKEKHEVLDRSIALQKELESRASQSKDYIRPIVLCQAQNASKEKETETFERIKQDLIQKGISESHIAIKTSNKDEIKGIDLLSKTCAIRYIITVDALKEGWDCPFAYILASLANKTSEIQIEQIVGRVLRKPYTKPQKDLLLNMSYVITSSNKFQEVLDKVVKALNHQGFSKEDVKKVSVENFAQPAFTFSSTTTSTSSSYSTDSEDFEPSQVNDAETAILVQEAEALAQEDSEQQKALENATTKPAPNDIKDDITYLPMKPQFREIASQLHLPQFFIKTPKMSAFGSDEERFLDWEALLKGFSLEKQSVDIPFDKILIDLYEIDIERQNEQESTYSLAKASEQLQREYMEAFAKMSEEGKKSNLLRTLTQKLGKLPPFSEANLRNYIKKVIETFKPDELNEVFSKQGEYAEKIKKHILNLATAYAEKQFYKKIETEEIYVKPHFRLPEKLNFKESASIKNSLYEKVGKINDEEKAFISLIASLDNVLFWHKFENRGKNNFALNACFTNHYPDFLIVTKNNKKIIVEYKGNDRDNSDSENKNRLGKKWQELAGKDYRYFMVFQSRELTGTYHLDSIKEVIGAL